MVEVNWILDMVKVKSDKASAYPNGIKMNAKIKTTIVVKLSWLLFFIIVPSLQI